MGIAAASIWLPRAVLFSAGLRGLSVKYMSRILIGGVAVAGIGLCLAMCRPQTEMGFLYVAMTVWPAYIVMLISALFICDEKEI
jgi:hypothetical protein